MAAAKKKRRTKSDPRRQQSAKADESRASDAVTVAWTVAVTAVLLCDLVMVALHYTVVRDEAGERIRMLHELLLFAGVVTGTLAMILLVVVYRVRRAPPPPGLAVFSVCVSAASLLAVLMRGLQ